MRKRTSARRLARRSIILFGALMVALVGALTAFTSDGLREIGFQDMDPIQIAPTTTTPTGSTGSTTIGTTTVGTTTEEGRSLRPRVDPDDLLEAVLARTGAPIVSASLGDPPSDARGQEQQTPSSVPAPATGRTLYITVDAADAPGAALRGVWIEDLIGGALNDDLEANGYKGLVTIVHNVRDPNQNIVEVSAGFGNVALYQQFSMESVNALATRVQAGAESLGLTVVSIDIYSPMQNAPALVVRSNEPERYITGDLAPVLLDTVFGSTSNLEGYYLELQQSNGTAVLKTAAANRAGAGIDWTDSNFAPDLRE